MDISYRDILVAKQIGLRALNEASLGRLYQHIQKHKYQSFGIISAELDIDKKPADISGQEWKRQNEKRTKDLENLLSNWGYGYFPLWGIRIDYDEPSDHDPSKRVETSRRLIETSFFIPGISFDHIIRAAKKFNQDWVIYSEDRVRGFDQDGNLIRDLGSFHPGRISSFVSKMKGGGEFAFEAIATSWTEGLVSNGPVTEQDQMELDIKLKSMDWGSFVESPESFDKMVHLQVLDEHTLSRIWQHTQGKNAIAMMTAFKGKYTYDRNVSRNIALANQIRNNGYGYFWMEGHYIENKGTPDEKPVTEDSLFVVGGSENDRIKRVLLGLAKEYEQESIFFKPAGETRGYIINIDGSVEQGPLLLHPDKMGEYYSVLRFGSHAGRPFVFERAGWSRSNLGKFIMHHKLKEGKK